MDDTDSTETLTLPREIMTADEVASLLGVNRKTVYEAAGRREIPHRRLGRRVLFSRTAIMAWLSTAPPPPAPPPPREPWEWRGRIRR